MSWEFLEATLLAFVFLVDFVRLIMVCVTVPSYSVNINGTPCGCFLGARGLRPGNPLSPYLYCAWRSYLRGWDWLCKSSEFHFHPRCSQVKLCHLIFADDLVLFSRGDLGSINVLRRCFQQFGQMSGLIVKQDKSEIYLGGVPPKDASDFIQQTGVLYRLFSIPVS